MLSDEIFSPSDQLLNGRHPDLEESDSDSRNTQRLLTRQSANEERGMISGDYKSRPV